MGSAAWWAVAGWLAAWVFYLRWMAERQERRGWEELCEEERQRKNYWWNSYHCAHAMLAAQAEGPTNPTQAKERE